MRSSFFSSLCLALIVSVPSANVISISSGLNPATGAVIRYLPSACSMSTGRRKYAGSPTSLERGPKTPESTVSTLRSIAASSATGFQRVMRMVDYLLFLVLALADPSLPSLPTTSRRLNMSFGLGQQPCLGTSRQRVFPRRGGASARPTGYRQRGGGEKNHSEVETLNRQRTEEVE